MCNYVSHVAYGAAVTTMLEPAQRRSPNSSSHSSCNSSCRATLLYTTDTSHVKWSMMSMHKSDRKSEDQCIAPSLKNWFQIWPSLWFDVAIAHEAAQGNACTKKIGNPPARILSKCIVSPWTPFNGCFYYLVVGSFGALGCRKEYKMPVTIFVFIVFWGS